MSHIDPRVLELFGRAFQTALGSFPDPAPAAVNASEDGSVYAPEVGSEDDGEAPGSGSTSRGHGSGTPTALRPSTRSSSRTIARAAQPPKRSASARTVKTPPSPDPSAPPPPIKKRKLTHRLVEAIQMPAMALDESNDAPAPDLVSAGGVEDVYPSCDACTRSSYACTWERKVIDLRLEGNPKPETACVNCKVQHSSCHLSTSALEAFRARQHRRDDVESPTLTGSKKVKRTLAEVFEINRQTYKRVGELAEALQTANGTFTDFLARTDSAASGSNQKKGKGKAP